MPYCLRSLAFFGADANITLLAFNFAMFYQEKKKNDKRNSSAPLYTKLQE